MTCKILKKEYRTLILLLGIALFIGILSWFTPWLGDDIHYGFHCIPGKRDLRITTIAQIIGSQNSHWFIANGRYVAHVMVQFVIAIMGQPIFAIINGLMYIPLLLLVAKFSHIDLKNVRTLSAMAVMVLISLQTKFTPSCQIGYIWTFTLTLLFLYFFFKENFTPQWWAILLLGGYSVISGNGQEALNIGVGGALIVYWGFNMRRMKAAQYVMMIGFGIGALLNCLSPGSISRAGCEDGGSSLVGSTVRFLLESRAFYMLVIVVIWRVRKFNDSFYAIYKSNEFYWNVWAILLIFNFILGVNGHRQLFGEELMSIILSFRMIGVQRINNGWLVVMFGALIWIYAIIGISNFQGYFQWESIKKQYAASTNGIVYVNMNRPLEDWWFEPMRFGDKLTYSKTGEQPNYAWLESKSNLYLHHFYPGKPDVTVVTPLLQGLDSVNLRNQIIPMKLGRYLIIQNKQSPKRPMLKSFSKYGINSDTICEPIDMTTDIVLETPYWKAKQMRVGALSAISRTKQVVEFE